MVGAIIVWMNNFLFFRSSILWYPISRSKLPLFSAWVLWPCHVSLLSKISPRHFILCTHGILVPLNSKACGRVTHCIVNITALFLSVFIHIFHLCAQFSNAFRYSRSCCWQWYFTSCCCYIEVTRSKKIESDRDYQKNKECVQELKVLWKKKKNCTL